MAITISYKVKHYPNSHIVYKMKELILENKYLLEVVANIYTALDDVEVEEKLADSSNIRIICKIVRKHIRTGRITQEVGSKFLELWESITNEQLGLVLEQIVSRIGPFNMRREDVDLSMDVKIYETNKQKDFDVVFFNSMYSVNKNYGSRISIEGNSEFHECKKNICTYIPYDPRNELRVKTKEKLDFIEETHSLHNEAKFYMPTLHAIVNQQREFLEKYQNGKYNFINIIDIKELMQLAG